MIDHPSVQQVSKNPKTLYIQVINNTCELFQKKLHIPKAMKVIEIEN